MLEKLRLIRVAHRDDTEEEARDPLAVHGHVQRQEEDEEQVAEDADAGHGDVAQRPGEVAGTALEVRQQLIDLVVEADLAAAQIVQLRLQRLENLAQMLRIVERLVVDQVVDRCV